METKRRTPNGKLPPDLKAVRPIVWMQALAEEVMPNEAAALMRFFIWERTDSKGRLIDGAPVRLSHQFAMEKTKRSQDTVTRGLNWYLDNSWLYQCDTGSNSGRGQGISSYWRVKPPVEHTAPMRSDKKITPQNPADQTAKLPGSDRTSADLKASAKESLKATTRDAAVPEGEGTEKQTLYSLDQAKGLAEDLGLGTDRQLVARLHKAVITHLKDLDAENLAASLEFLANDRAWFRDYIHQGHVKNHAGYAIKYIQTTAWTADNDKEED